VLLLCVVLRLLVGENRENAMVEAAERWSRRRRANHNVTMTMKEEGFKKARAAGEEDDTDTVAKKTCGERKNRDNGERRRHDEAAQPMPLAESNH
jgi:hypothetical protein